MRLNYICAPRATFLPRIIPENENPFISLIAAVRCGGERFYGEAATHAEVHANVTESNSIAGEPHVVLFVFPPVARLFLLDAAHPAVANVNE